MTCRAMKNLILNIYILSYKLIFLSLSPEAWQQGINVFSYSRYFYGLSDFISITIITAYCMYWRVINNVLETEKSSYLYALITSQAILLLWIPIRIYYIVEIKNLLLGFQGLGMELLVIIIMIILLRLNLYKIWKIKINLLLPLFILAFLSTIFYIGFFGKKFIGLALGLGSDFPGCQQGCYILIKMNNLIIPNSPMQGIGAAAFGGKLPPIKPLFLIL